SFGLSAIHHDRSSRGAQAYLQLAGAVIRRDTAPEP
ncbi:MAG: ParA family protein, partial [Gammaproteobacteria bacterium]|nr:ParA family protein [Gammaproteobacteria bacterium]